MTIVDLFANPTRFFRDRAEKDPGFRAPVVTLSFWVIMTVITVTFLSAPLTEKFASAYSEELVSFGSITKYASVFGSILNPFVMWLLLGIVFFVISYFLKGK